MGVHSCNNPTIGFQMRGRVVGEVHVPRVHSDVQTSGLGLCKHNAVPKNKMLLACSPIRVLWPKMSPINHSHRRYRGQAPSNCCKRFGRVCLAMS